MHTPRAIFACPRCDNPYEIEQNFCGRCGAEMRGADAGPDDDGRSDAEPARRAGRRKRERRRSRRRRHRRRRGRRAADDARWLGHVVDNRYRVLEVIGRGGMGVVYRVEHLRMGKIAAMKVLHHDLERDPQVSQRFRNEAAAISRLTHPNTVQVFDFGAARGALYLIMEFIRGRDIGSIVKRDGPMPLSRAAPLIAQIAAALDEAHERGVIHRDLKPENVLVTRTHGGHDFVKVLDFGLAKLAERDEPKTSETEPGASTSDDAIVGTPHYMSPEQIRGDPIDARADIYSLGALTYRLLTGEPPFVAKNPVGVLTKHLTEPLVPPSERRPDLGISPEIDALIARAMSKDAARRHPSATALADDLTAAYRAARPASSRGATADILDASDSAAILAADIDYGMDSALRLRRADLDSYESSLRRRRWGRMLAVPAVIATLAAGGYYYLRVLESRPLESEREPNDTLADANRIAAGPPVTGLLGKRVSIAEGDRDFYRVAAGDDRLAGLSAEVTAIPNIDIALRLYAPGGQLIDAVDENGVGQPEAIGERAVEGDVVVLVAHRERAPGDRSLPTENVSDAYELRVTRRPIDTDDRSREREPNDGPEAASPLSLGAPVLGTLDRRSDVDCFRFDGAPGTYRLTITGAAGADLRWSAGDAGGREREARVSLERGTIVRVERGDRDAPRDRPLAATLDPYRLLVTAELPP